MPPWIAISILIFTTCVSLALPWCKDSCLIPWNNLHWFYHISSYSKMGHPEWFALVFRIPVIFIGAFAGLAFMSLISDSKMAFTRIGEKTIYIYLIHIIIIKIFNVIGFFSKFENTALSFLLIPVGILLAYLLSAKVIQTATMPLIEPIRYFEKLRNK